MYSFTGSSRPRPMINLGGQSVNGTPNKPSEVMRKAKEERQLRERFKHRQAACTTVQSFWRSRQVALRTKIELREQFDQLILSAASQQAHSSTSHQSSSSSVPLSPQDHLKLSRLLLLFYTPSNTNDHQRMATWANLLILHASAPHIIYNAQNDEIGLAWRGAISILMTRKILRTLADYPRSEHCTTYLQAVKEIIDDRTRRIDEHGLTRLVNTYYWKCLKSHIVSFDFNDKPTVQTASPAIELCVLPFKHLNSFNLPLDQRRTLMVSFVAEIFTIPLLPNRLDIRALVRFSTSLPLEDMVYLTSDVIHQLELPEIVHLLSNVLVWGSKKTASMSSEGFTNYMNSLQLCIDRIPCSLFDRVDAHLEKKKPNHPKSFNQNSNANHARKSLRPGLSTLPGSHNDVIMHVEGSEAEAAPSSSLEPPSASVTPLDSVLNTLNPRTFQWLSTLISSDHLSQLYSVSNKYAATSRSHFCRLMVAIIFAWPSSREKVLNSLIFSPIFISGGQSTGNNSGGLMRELWRSCVRSGKVGISLRDRKFGGSPQGVLTTLNDGKMAGEWEYLILLSELYSKCLMTLADDEFFNDETKVSGAYAQRQNQPTLSTGRNPLMLDEVIGLAGLLRNLAFGLYWTEGQANIKQGYVVGTNVSLEQLRNLATRLLQQIYTRDSRRPFSEAGFWSMTSTFDLRSFIQTVVYEETHSEELQHEQPQPPSHSINWDPDVNLLQHLPSSSHDSRAKIVKRQLAFISPRIGVLNNIPFVIPFEQRVAIFRTFVESDRHRFGLGPHHFSRPRNRASIRRGYVSEDGFLHLNPLGPKLKEPIEIKFIDQYGLEEAGIDGGGVFKEFLTSLTKEAFDANQGLWLVNKNQELYPNPHSYSREPLSLEWYSFLGRVLGKALYEGILIDVDFADFFLNKWLGKQSYLDDLASLDPELYQGLLFLKHYKGDVESDLSLNFTIAINEFDNSETVELIPNGAKTSVTALNRISYIYLVSNYKLNVQLDAQCTAFFKGLNDIIELRWLRMFNQVEMRVLVGGLDGQDLDIDDLQRWTVYGGWDESHHTIRMFWRVLSQFDNKSKRKLLKFVTSCSRPPLLGFKELRPSFAIRSSGTDQTRLPSASTCVNLLKLPEYETEEQLREKLLYAINAGAGFDLS